MQHSHNNIDLPSIFSIRKELTLQDNRRSKHSFIPAAFAAVIAVLLAAILTGCQQKPSSAPGTTPDHVHTEAIDAPVASTCTTPGLTEGTHCSTCGENLVAQEAIPGAHSYNNGICTLCNQRKPSDGLEYALSEDGISYTVTGRGKCKDEVVVVPTEHEGKPVTAIGVAAFEKSKKMQEIYLPEGLLTIEERAFDECAVLKTVVCPETLNAIGDWAFRNCKKLTQINLPDS